ncbi:unnamed protein product [[Candida] boidinii]|nr:unnamed protein product [[Candida] boidinii]
MVCLITTVLVYFGIGALYFVIHIPVAAAVAVAAVDVVSEIAAALVAAAEIYYYAVYPTHFRKHLLALNMTRYEDLVCMSQQLEQKQEQQKVNLNF